MFEIETAAGFLLFADHPADVTLLEVGLGGRLDATNVVERPLASVITPVSIDHIEFLGDTLEKIASEKAAIMKRGVPAVIGRQAEGPLSVIARHADEVGAPLHALGQEWMIGEERGRLVYQDAEGLLDLPAPKLFGRHQFDNAGTAIAALRAAGLDLAGARIRGRRRARRLAGAHAAADGRASVGAGAARQRTLARRRTQCRWRTRRRRGAGRS